MNTNTQADQAAKIIIRVVIAAFIVACVLIVMNANVVNL